jgi:hypothetical protein
MLRPGVPIKIFPFLLIGVLIIGCAAPSLREYRVEHPQEEGIRSALIAFEAAWNTRDEPALLDLLDDDFTFWVWSGGNRRIVFRKGTFGFELGDLFVDWRYVGFGKPDILIKNDRAAAYVAVIVDGRGYRSTFRFIKRDDRWLVLELEM